MSEVEAASAVKVAVRIRPCDDDVNDVKQSDQDPNVVIVSDERAFQFDKVFGETSTQDAVYNEMLREQTERFVNGYNCASLAYGQTGTGKTYSMGFQEEHYDTDQSGMAPRVLEDVFALAEQKYGENGWRVCVSFIEIYNEKVFDLFSENPAVALKSLHYKPKDFEKVEVASVEETIQLLTLANGSRHTRSTPLNANSSRSHAIFTVRISVTKGATTTDSAFHLVDLAGSEGVKRTGHQGIALSEGNHINKGLLAVSKVLQAMASNNKVVPYRDSVLTQVLQDALILNSYITLLACISPAESNVSETLSTLRFAHNIKQLKTTPQINQIVNELKKGKTPSKYGAPLRSIQNNRFMTPGKRALSMATPGGISTIKKQLRNTICTPTKRQRIDFENFNSTAIVEIPEAPVASVQEFFHPDNFRDAIGSDPRASVSSMVSGINISNSTEIDRAPSINNSCTNVVAAETPVQQKIPSFSPLMRRMTDLEAAVTNKFEKIQETMVQNQSVYAATSTPRQSVNHEDITEVIRKEIQTILRQELFSFATNLPNMTQNATQNPLDSISIPDEPLTPRRVFRPNAAPAPAAQQIVHLDETNAENGFIAPSDVTRRASRRRTNVPSDVPLRRSARLSSVPRPAMLAPPSPPKQRNRSLSRRREVAPTKNKQIASYFKSRESIDPKVAKSKHIAAVFELMNTGSIKELQVLPKIGHKTAYQIVTTRIMKGRYKTLKDIGKLPIWRGKQWEAFLEANHLK
ncbi:kinesin-like protein Nod [Culicoides brevitarsis]|uniref:kinesin-like protein Nod n=1 Tax=Culicoides brevitarsis TaxID=469753 RepID=UPI00307B2CA7